VAVLTTPAVRRHSVLPPEHPFEQPEVEKPGGNGDVRHFEPTLRSAAAHKVNPRRWWAPRRDGRIAEVRQYWVLDRDHSDSGLIGYPYAD
jgi:hypothetical protein